MPCPLSLGRRLPRLSPRTRDLLNSGTRLHAVHPRLHLGVLGVEVILAREDHGNRPLPRNEREVGVRALVADEPLAAVERPLEDAADAANLVLIPLDGEGDLLGGVVHEPEGLAVVGALAGDLEVEPLLAVELAGGVGVAELVVLVVLLNEVLDDGARLPEGDASVGVLNGGEAAVGVDGEVGLLLHLGEVEELGLRGDPELLHDEGNLPGVGPAGVRPVDDGLHFD